MSGGLINTSLEFSGLDDEYQAPSKSSPNIENKTNKLANKTDTSDSRFKNESQQLVEQTGESNVLNGYRSVTYNFTFACLRKKYLENPDELRKSETELVILKSGGKGYAGISSDGINSSMYANQSRADYSSRDPRRLDISQNEKSKPLTNYGQELLDGFNKTSPGRFDMFIENVEIESLMSFTPNSNASMPTKLKFEVIEPYSVNGFIEALYVTSLAAGYPNYIAATFLLKVEFKGYPDDDINSFRDPVTIPNSTRYFPVCLTNIEVDITEKGTRYRIEAVPTNERAFGQPNVINKPIKMEGQSIKEILTNLIENVNKQAIDTWKQTSTNARTDEVDVYDIKFPSWSESDGWIDSDNAIAKEKIVELYKDNALYKLVDPATVDKSNGYKANGAKKPTEKELADQPEKIKYDPKKTVIQFPEKMNIHDIISAIVRDSEYVRNILKDIKKYTDSYGMVDYFMIRLETTNTDVINPMSKKPVQKITYVVSPYKVHYTKIPNLADNVVDEKDLKKLSLREYNYIYTGKNIDILNFKLNFNTLFFEAIPVAMGNKETPESRTAAGNDNNVKTTQNSPDVETTKKMQVPLPPKKPVPVPVQSYSGNASQPLDDPYSVLARSMHDSIVNSKASMLTGELEILGDPFYLVTGGLGNYNPKPVNRGKLAEGEANRNYGSLMITVNFRNPIDIQPFEAGGTMYFDSNRVPFSGVYMVTQVNHTFKDGVFKQRLDIIRVPGQVIDYSVRPTDFTQSLSSSPSPEDRVLPTTGPTPRFGQRLDSATAFEQLERGLPSPGLPGIASNFVSATGGVGDVTASLLNRTPGLGDLLSAGSSIIGQALPTDITSNLRLNATGLSKLTLGNLDSAALTNAATNILTGNVPFKQAASSIAGQVIGANVASLLKRSNIGSGIGEGASVPIDASLQLNPTALDIKYGSTFNSVDSPSLSLSNVGSTIKDLGSSAMSAVSELGKDAASLVGGVGDKLRSLTSTPLDPNAIGASVGLDPSMLSGLSSPMQSKVLDQIKTMAGNVPSDVNLDQSVTRGLVLDYIPSGRIGNIPATAPYSVAPDADVELPITSSAASFNPLASTVGSRSPVDLTINKDKILSAQTQISKITGSPVIPDKNIIGSVSSKFGTVSSSPLDKLVNRLGDPSAPPYTGDDPIIRKRLGLPPLE